jgi:hypothetical protein
VMREVKKSLLSVVWVMIECFKYLFGWMLNIG